MLELEITVPGTELYDEATNTFINTKDQKLVLKHSLLSVSKWEALTHKSFFTDEDKRTKEEHILYLQCMTINPNVDPMCYYAIFSYPALLNKIVDYTNNPMTATTFPKTRASRSREKTTTELIYFWMTMFNIPKECEKWHLNRLMTLIRICEAKQGNNKKMSKRQIYAQNRELNELRKAKLHSRG